MSKDDGEAQSKVMIEFRELLKEWHELATLYARSRMATKELKELIEKTKEALK
jgi:hypothetical protein